MLSWRTDRQTGDCDQQTWEVWDETLARHLGWGWELGVSAGCGSGGSDEDSSVKTMTAQSLPLRVCTMLVL